MRSHRLGRAVIQWLQFLQEENLNTDTQRRDHHLKMETEIAVMCPQAKKDNGLLVTTRS